jgi:hypothetical protein
MPSLAPQVDVAGTGYQLRFELPSGAAWAGAAGAVLWAESNPLSVAAGPPFRVVVINAIGRCIAGQACLDQVCGQGSDSEGERVYAHELALVCELMAKRLSVLHDEPQVDTRLRAMMRRRRRSRS